MKKLFTFLFLFFISTSAFAGGYRPASDTWQACIQKPYDQCAQYGNPWVPNWPTMKNYNGQWVPNDPAPSTFIPYDAAKWQGCAQPIYSECNKKFGRSF